MTEVNRDANNIPPAQPPPANQEEPNAMQLMLRMQQQQMEMQQQMAALMTQLIPAPGVPNQQTRRPTRAKLERPTIDADCSDNRWIIFRDAWARYKEMASLTSASEIRNELRSACSEKINEMLFNFAGPDALNNATENELMNHIKTVAVRAVHPEVYRQQFFTMRQTDGESVTNFISRLKAQAMLCAFNSKGSCNTEGCTVSFFEDMVKSQLIAGTRNPSHQSKVLSEMEGLKTLDQVTSRLLALESTERASTHFRPSSEVAPIFQQQRQNNKAKFLPKSSPQKPGTNCVGCGHAFHPKGRSACPAWQKTCRKCGKPNHFSSVCRSSNPSTTNAAMTIEENPFELSSIITEPL